MSVWNVYVWLNAVYVQVSSDWQVPLFNASFVQHLVHDLLACVHFSASVRVAQHSTDHIVCLAWGGVELAPREQWHRCFNWSIVYSSDFLSLSIQPFLTLCDLQSCTALLFAAIQWEKILTLHVFVSDRQSAYRFYRWSWSFQSEKCSLSFWVHIRQKPCC